MFENDDLRNMILNINTVDIMAAIKREHWLYFIRVVLEIEREYTRKLVQQLGIETWLAGSG